MPGVSGVSEDSRWLAIYAPYTPWLYVYSLPGLEPVATLTNRANVSGFAFSVGGDQVAVSSRLGLEFWSTATWARTRVVTNFINILMSPDPSVYWLSRNYRSGGLFDAKTLELLLPLPTGTLPLALSRDGRYLAVNVDARRLQLWDLREVRNQLRALGLDWQGGLQETAALGQ